MASQVSVLSAEVFSKVKPTQLSCALQRFSASATVTFAVPCIPQTGPDREPEPEQEHSRAEQTIASQHAHE